MEAQKRSAFDVECPHCHRQFTAPLMEGSAARYRGFKCPHCRLFVPETTARTRAPQSGDAAG
jgi:hypothetical protein